MVSKLFKMLFDHHQILTAIEGDTLGYNVWGDVPYRTPYIPGPYLCNVAKSQV